MTTSVLVSGSAGFIGFHFCQRLLETGYTVLGIDNLNDYYDIRLKHARLDILRQYSNFIDLRYDLASKELIQPIFAQYRPEYCVNLAAQAGVRYSLENPEAYIHSNISGLQCLLEACRRYPVKHLIFASSSSVYGANKKIPFSETDHTDHPISLYAASKKANEMMAHSYAHLYDIPSTGLRFFTVYGPYGRPDMAYYIFARKISRGEPIKIFNHGNMRRDFTYIDDIVESMVRLLVKPPKSVIDFDHDHPDPAQSPTAPYRILNIGNDKPENLDTFIEIIEKKLGKNAIKEFMPMQPGDVESTWANIDRLASIVNFRPKTALEDGLDEFIKWFNEFHRHELVA